MTRKDVTAERIGHDLVQDPDRHTADDAREIDMKIGGIEHVHLIVRQTKGALVHADTEMGEATNPVTIDAELQSQCPSLFHLRPTLRKMPMPSAPLSSQPCSQMHQT